jgi:ABC-type lipoprotein export system ATPase subunit
VTTGELSDLLAVLHREGATLLVITHNPAVAGRAQRRITIRDGRLAEQAGPAAVTPGGRGPAGEPGAPHATG